MPGVLACCCDPPEPQGECGSICRSACCFYTEAKIGGWSHDWYECLYDDSDCATHQPINTDDPSTYMHLRVLVNDGLMVPGPDMEKFNGVALSSGGNHCASWVSLSTYSLKIYRDLPPSGSTCPTSELISEKTVYLIVSWSYSGHWEYGYQDIATTPIEQQRNPHYAAWADVSAVGGGGGFNNNFYNSSGSLITSCCGGPATSGPYQSACAQEDTNTYVRHTVESVLGAVSNNYCCRCPPGTSCVDTSPASEAQCQDGTGGDSDANFCGDGTGGSRDNNNECPP